MDYIMEAIKNYSTMTLIYTGYLLLINGFVFVLMGIDKKKALKNQWRISEYTLMVLALAGGSIGVLLAMVIFHHKNSKKKFYLGVPILYGINKIINIIIYSYFL